jgi:hypothetical protein
MIRKPVLRKQVLVAAVAWYGSVGGAAPVDSARTPAAEPSPVPVAEELSPNPSEIVVSPAVAIGPGSGVVLRPRRSRSDAGSRELIIHFHGGVDAVRQAMDRGGGDETVLVVSMPGLSAAYAQPFRDEPGLFHRLLALPLDDRGGMTDEVPAWTRVTLSCFSAGYGAVREILRSPAVERIDAVVAADSIYAGIEGEAANRRPSQTDMAAFLAFAREAADGKRVFVVAHSAQTTPYASTTETASALLSALGLSRTTVAAAADAEFSEVTRSQRGGLLVIGYSGESAAAHLHHLRILEQHWAAAKQLEAGR